MTFQIRPATPSDLTAIESVEAAADQLFVEAFHAIDWPAPDPASSRLAAPGYLLVGVHPSAGVIGFVHVLDLEGNTHLEQLSVDPSYGRKGYGAALVRAALAEASARGYGRMTLRTYADVAWNGPFYASLGFVESEADSDALRRCIDTERGLGLVRYGRRVQMSHSLGVVTAAASESFST